MSISTIYFFIELSHDIYEIAILIKLLDINNFFKQINFEFNLLPVVSILGLGI